jgi:hypothetical protein
MPVGEDAGRTCHRWSDCVDLAVIGGRAGLDAPPTIPPVDIRVRALGNHIFLIHDCGGYLPTGGRY